MILEHNARCRSAARNPAPTELPQGPDGPARCPGNRPRDLADTSQGLGVESRKDHINKWMVILHAGEDSYRAEGLK